jgi:pimeloyl-ACP methyl ester carboxylesterase
MLRSQLPADVQKVLDHHQAKGFFAYPEWYLGDDRLRPPACMPSRPLARRRGARVWARFGTQVCGTMWGQRIRTGHRQLEVMGSHRARHEIYVPTLSTCGRYTRPRRAHVEDTHRRIPGSEFVIFKQSSHLA